MSWVGKEWVYGNDADELLKFLVHIDKGIAPTQEEENALKKIGGVGFGQANHIPRSIGRLSNLVYLSLKNTNITELPLQMRQLSNLQELNLENTNIIELPDYICTLPALKKLNLRNVTLRRIPLSLVERRLPFCFNYYWNTEYNGILLDGTTLLEQDKDVFRSDDHDLILSYYAAEDSVQREGKVLFLGDGGVGKTYTIRRILKEGNLLTKNEETEMTYGVELEDYHPEIRDYIVADKELTIHFWDFGGQSQMRSMHSCFLTPQACYVIMLKSRDERNTEKVRYWMKSIERNLRKGEQRDERSTVILALNEWNGYRIWDLNLAKLEQEFQCNFDPVYFSAKDDSKLDFNKLTRVIVERVWMLVADIKYPDRWAMVRKRLSDCLNTDKKFILWSEYQTICRNCCVAEKIHKPLLKLLTLSGACFSTLPVNETGNWSSCKIVSPRWLTVAAYNIILSGSEVSDKGIIFQRNIQNLLKNPKKKLWKGIKYKTEEVEYILQILRRYHISYQISPKREFVPALCIQEQPKDMYPTNYQYHSKYRMSYAYLPDAVLHQLMIKYHGSLNDDKLWRHGMCIENSEVGITIIIEKDDDEQHLYIDLYSTQGREAVGQWMNDIRATLKTINGDDNLKLSAEEEIIMSKDGQVQPFPVASVELAREQGISVLYGTSGGLLVEYTVSEILMQACLPEKKEDFYQEPMKRIAAATESMAEENKILREEIATLTKELSEIKKNTEKSPAEQMNSLLETLDKSKPYVKLLVKILKYLPI